MAEYPNEFPVPLLTSVPSLVTIHLTLVSVRRCGLTSSQLPNCSGPTSSRPAKSQKPCFLSRGTPGEHQRSSAKGPQRLSRRLHPPKIGKQVCVKISHVNGFKPRQGRDRSKNLATKTCRCLRRRQLTAGTLRIRRR